MYPSPDPRILCLLQSAGAHPLLAAAEVPSNLLSPPERAHFDRLVVVKRRRDWLLGRWTAKHLVQSYLELNSGYTLPLDRIEILAGEDGAPYAQAGERLPVSLSISHSGSESFCAVCASDAGEVGADVEQIETRENSFLLSFFTETERAAVHISPASDRDAEITALWSVKEAVLKTMHLGLRADTRAVEVRLSRPISAWRPAEVTVRRALLPSASAFVNAWHQVQAGHVLSLAFLHN